MKVVLNVPNHNETMNSVTDYVYKAEILALRDKYKYDGNVATISVAVLIAALGLLSGWITQNKWKQLVTTAVLTGLGLIDTFASQRVRAYNLYSNLYDEMNRSENPVIYVKITQPMIYKVMSQVGEGWISNGLPSINRYYQDW